MYYFFKEKQSKSFIFFNKQTKIWRKGKESLFRCEFNFKYTNFDTITKFVQAILLQCFYKFHFKKKAKKGKRTKFSWELELYVNTELEVLDIRQTFDNAKISLSPILSVHRIPTLNTQMENDILLNWVVSF